MKLLLVLTLLSATALTAVSGASAATGVFTDGGSDYQGEYWADIETYGVDANTNRFDLSVGGPDLVDDYYDQDHTLIFRLDTDGDYDTDFSVITNGGTLDGVYAGENSYTRRLCPVSAKLSSTGAHVVAATRCVGNPASVHVAVLLMSGRDTCGYGICRESSLDFAPDAHSLSYTGEERFSPAVTVTAVPAPSVQPKVRAFKSTGTVGGLARIRVATEAKSQYTTYVVKVSGRQGTIATLKRPVRSPGLIQTLQWRVPRSIKAQRLTITVVASGPSGKSRPSSAQLVLRRLAST